MSQKKTTPKKLTLKKSAGKKPTARAPSTTCPTVPKEGGKAPDFKAVVLGVSPDSPSRHEKFRAKFDLPFTLIADEQHEVAEKYGVWREKSMYGRVYMGIARTTFVIDAGGKIAKVFQAVKPKGHDQEVLAVIAALE